MSPSALLRRCAALAGILTASILPASGITFLPAWDYEDQPALGILWDDGELLSNPLLHPEWTVSPASEVGRVRISTLNSVSGRQSVGIFPATTSPDTLNVFLNLGLPETDIVHADLRLMPVVQSSSVPTATFDLGGLQFRLQNTGNGLARFAFRGGTTGGFTPVGDPVPFRENRADLWSRITVRLDRSGAVHTADVWINNRPLLRDVALPQTEGTPLSSGLRISGPLGSARPLHLDDVLVSELHPLFQDADRDGIPDTQESGYFSYGRADDPDDDGLSSIQEYMLGTRPDTADTDGDGMADGMEVQFGFNPLLADAAGDRDGDGIANTNDPDPGNGSSVFDPTRVFVRSTPGPGTPNGSSQQPFQYVSQAVAAVSPGGTVLISGEVVLAELISIHKDVTFIGLRGAAGSRCAFVPDSGAVMPDGNSGSVAGKFQIYPISAGSIPVVRFQDIDFVGLGEFPNNGGYQKSAGGAVLAYGANLSFQGCRFESCTSGSSFRIWEQTYWTEEWVEGYHDDDWNWIPGYYTGNWVQMYDGRWAHEPVGGSAGGGAVYIRGGSAVFEDCTFDYCAASDESGGSEGKGGAVCIESAAPEATDGLVTFTRSRFRGCSSTDEGGAIYTGRTASLEACLITACVSRIGGALAITGQEGSPVSVIDGSTLAGNYGWEGATISASSGAPVALTNSILWAASGLDYRWYYTGYGNPLLLAGTDTGGTASLAHFSLTGCTLPTGQTLPPSQVATLLISTPPFVPGGWSLTTSHRWNASSVSGFPAYPAGALDLNRVPRRTTGAASRGALEWNDADADGMEDEWERLNGFNPAFAGDAGQDADGDGFTNLEEFQAGTTPRNQADSANFVIYADPNTGNDAAQGTFSQPVRSVKRAVALANGKSTVTRVILRDGIFTGADNRGVLPRAGLTIRGLNGRDRVTIDCSGQDRAFLFATYSSVSSNLINWRLEGVTIRNGAVLTTGPTYSGWQSDQGSYGGGVLMDTRPNAAYTGYSYLYYNLAIRGCRFSGCSAWKGGAVAKMTPPHGGYEGAEPNSPGAFKNQKLEISDTEFAANDATSSGGAIYCRGALSLSGACDLAYNSAAVCGGAICVGGSTNMNGGRFFRNTAPLGGAAAGESWDMYTSRSLTATATQFFENYAWAPTGSTAPVAGGAVEGSNLSTTLTAAVLTRNRAASAGTGTATGGAISASSLNLTRSTLTENTVAGTGAGLSVTGASPQLLSSAFVSNTATGSGGAIYAGSSAYFRATHCTFTYNQAAAGTGQAIQCLATTPPYSQTRLLNSLIWIHNAPAVAGSAVAPHGFIQSGGSNVQYLADAGISLNTTTAADKNYSIEPALAYDGIHLTGFSALGGAAVALTSGAAVTDIDGEYRTAAANGGELDSGADQCVCTPIPGSDGVLIYDTIPDWYKKRIIALQIPGLDSLGKINADTSLWGGWSLSTLLAAGADPAVNPISATDGQVPGAAVGPQQGPAFALRQGDPDHDGISTADEGRLGTDPLSEYSWGNRQNPPLNNVSDMRRALMDLTGSKDAAGKDIPNGIPDICDTGHPEDWDGDGRPNDEDAVPWDARIDWAREEPRYVMIEMPDVPVDSAGVPLTLLRAVGMDEDGRALYCRPYLRAPGQPWEEISGTWVWEQSTGFHELLAGGAKLNPLSEQVSLAFVNGGNFLTTIDAGSTIDAGVFGFTHVPNRLTSGLPIGSVFPFTWTNHGATVLSEVVVDSPAVLWNTRVWGMGARQYGYDPAGMFGTAFACGQWNGPSNSPPVPAGIGPLLSGIMLDYQNPRGIDIPVTHAAGPGGTVFHERETVYHMNQWQPAARRPRLERARGLWRDDWRITEEEGYRVNEAFAAQNDGASVPRTIAIASGPGSSGHLFVLRDNQKSVSFPLYTDPHAGYFAGANPLRGNARGQILLGGRESYLERFSVARQIWRNGRTYDLATLAGLPEGSIAAGDINEKGIIACVHQGPDGDRPALLVPVDVKWIGMNAVTGAPVQSPSMISSDGTEPRMELNAISAAIVAGGVQVTASGEYRDPLGDVSKEPTPFNHSVRVYGPKGVLLAQTTGTAVTPSPAPRPPWSYRTTHGSFSMTFTVPGLGTGEHALTFMTAPNARGRSGEAVAGILIDYADYKHGSLSLSQPVQMDPSSDMGMITVSGGLTGSLMQHHASGPASIYRGSLSGNVCEMRLLALPGDWQGLIQWDTGGGRLANYAARWKLQNGIYTEQPGARAFTDHPKQLAVSSAVIVQNGLPAFSETDPGLTAYAPAISIQDEFAGLPFMKFFLNGTPVTLERPFENTPDPLLQQFDFSYIKKGTGIFTLIPGLTPAVSSPPANAGGPPVDPGRLSEPTDTVAKVQIATTGAAAPPAEGDPRGVTAEAVVVSGDEHLAWSSDGISPVVYDVLPPDLEGAIIPEDPGPYTLEAVEMVYASRYGPELARQLEVIQEFKGGAPPLGGLLIQIVDHNEDPIFGDEPAIELKNHTGWLWNNTINDPQPVLSISRHLCPDVDSAVTALFDQLQDFRVNWEDYRSQLRVGSKTFADYTLYEWNEQQEILRKEIRNLNPRKAFEESVSAFGRAMVDSASTLTVVGTLMVVTYDVSSFIGSMPNGTVLAMAQNNPAALVGAAVIAGVGAKSKFLLQKMRKAQAKKLVVRFKLQAQNLDLVLSQGTIAALANARTRREARAEILESLRQGLKHPDPAMRPTRADMEHLYVKGVISGADGRADGARFSAVRRLVEDMARRGKALLGKQQPHHDLPVEFEMDFAIRGLDINNGDFGRALDIPFHDRIHGRTMSPQFKNQGWSTGGGPWNDQWRGFFDTYPDATAEDVLEFHTWLVHNVTETALDQLGTGAAGTFWPYVPDTGKPKDNKGKPKMKTGKPWK